MSYLGNLSGKDAKHLLESSFSNGKIKKNQLNLGFEHLWQQMMSACTEETLRS